ncbi:hypothetical protein FA95DRAFT_1564552, partial [Auriscalpium vulgare]
MDPTPQSHTAPAPAADLADQLRDALRLVAVLRSQLMRTHDDCRTQVELLERDLAAARLERDALRAAASASTPASTPAGLREENRRLRWEKDALRQGRDAARAECERLRDTAEDDASDADADKRVARARSVSEGTVRRSARDRVAVCSCQRICAPAHDDRQAQEHGVRGAVHRAEARQAALDIVRANAHADTPRPPPRPRPNPASCARRPRPDAHRPQALMGGARPPV